MTRANKKRLNRSDLIYTVLLSFHVQYMIQPNLLQYSGLHSDPHQKEAAADRYREENGYQSDVLSVPCHSEAILTKIMSKKSDHILSIKTSSSLIVNGPNVTRTPGPLRSCYGNKFHKIDCLVISARPSYGLRPHCYLPLSDRSTFLIQPCGPYYHGCSTRLYRSLRPLRRT